MNNHVNRQPLNEAFASPTQFRTIWISDVHLGAAGCQAEALASFLKYNECERLYLVGDIIDGWRMKQNFYWPQTHTNVVRRVFTKAKRGTRVSYITGNHDEFLRKFVDGRLQFGNIEVVNEAIHETADGRKLLVTHGDMFDVITRYHRWVAMVGDVGYNALLKLNRHVHAVRSRFGLPYWSLANAAKQRVKSAVNFISDYEQAVAYEAHKRELDGVICGHIHNATIEKLHNVSYYNCGDWVESCTALAEDFNGHIRIIRWSAAEEKRHEQFNTERQTVAA